MKKLLLSFILINLFNSCVLADTFTGSCSISLTYTIEPSYKVKIPKQIDISEKTVTFNYYVRGDIYEDQTLNVLFDETVDMASVNNSFKAYISQEKTSFTCHDLSSEYKSFDACISHGDIKAGTYTGNLNVVISLIGGNNAN